MTIISLDLSTKSSGYAVFESGRLVESGVVTASSTDVIKRIQLITDKLNNIFKKYPHVDKVILEEVRPDGRGSGVGNQHTQKVLMWLQASIIFLLHDSYSEAEIVYTYPSEWRKKCGIQTGRGVRRDSLKVADIEFVKGKYGLSVNDDEADAICIGCAYAEQPSAW